MKRLRITLAVVAALAEATVAAAQPAADHVYGPPPTWEEYRAIAEPAVIARLIDPESARITWLSGSYKGGYKQLLGPRIAGYAACGSVNARNRMGGYTGATTFVVVVDYGRALLVDIDRRPNGANSGSCARAINTGLAPPVPAATPPNSAVSAPTPDIKTGLALRAMPEGAYVTGVVPGSAAQHAGLRPGMVIASVNAVALAGMGDAMLQVVRAAGATATLAIIGGTTVKLETKP